MAAGKPQKKIDEVTLSFCPIALFGLSFAQSLQHQVFSLLANLTLMVSTRQRLQPISNTISLFILFTGAFFRIWQYFYSGSFWLDEAFLAVNIIQNPLSSLFVEPLDSNQGAPLAFIFIVKNLSLLLGETDLVLRIFPLISGLLALPTTYYLSYSILKSATARICLIGLIAFSPVLIYYSSEFKQYSTDVFVCLLIILVALNFQHWKYGVFSLTLVGIVGVWFSHPSVFILTAIGVVIGLETLIKKQFRFLPTLCLIGFSWLASFAIIYFLSLRSLAKNSQLINFWTNGYAPAPINLTNLGWYWESALGLVYLTFFEQNAVGTPVLPQWFSTTNVFLLIVTTMGIIHLFFNFKRLFGIITLTITVSVFVSAFWLYPFRGRLVLFLIPLVFISMSNFVDWLSTSHNKFAKILAKVSAIYLVVILFMLPAVDIALNPHPHSDIKNAFNYVRIHRSPDDAIAMNIWAVPPFKFYAEQFDLNNMQVLGHFPNDTQPEEITQMICQYQLFRPTWFIFSHQYDERIAIVTQLQSKSSQFKAWEAGNAGAYLFDFTNTNLCTKSNN